MKSDKHWLTEEAANDIIAATECYTEEPRPAKRKAFRV
jgi:hypothetical protein